jgi:tRNA (cytidine/uridine-2'-O-)-methyltransferase
MRSRSSSAAAASDRLTVLETVLHVVLVAPEIPQNTGSIGRLCVATKSHLHLIDPLGFLVDDKHVRRAGLDYWEHVALTRHPSWDAFCSVKPPGRLLLFAARPPGPSYTTIRFRDDDVLVFGGESRGLPSAIRDAHADAIYTIPLHSPARPEPQPGERRRDRAVRRVAPARSRLMTRRSLSSSPSRCSRMRGPAAPAGGHVPRLRRRPVRHAHRPRLARARVGKTRLLVDPWFNSDVATRRPSARDDARQAAEPRRVLITHKHAGHLRSGRARGRSRRRRRARSSRRTWPTPSGARLPRGDADRLVGSHDRRPAPRDRGAGRAHARENGYVIVTDHVRTYVGGDTRWFDGLVDIATAFPDLDVAFLPIGGERLMGFRRTMNPEEAAKAAALLKPRRVIPILVRRRRRLPVRVVRGRSDQTLPRSDERGGAWGPSESSCSSRARAGTTTADATGWRSRRPGRDARRSRSSSSPSSSTCWRSA